MTTPAGNVFTEDFKTLVALRTSPETEYKLRQKLAQRILSQASLTTTPTCEKEAEEISSIASTVNSQVVKNCANYANLCKNGGSSKDCSRESTHSNEVLPNLSKAPLIRSAVVVKKNDKVEPWSCLPDNENSIDSDDYDSDVPHRNSCEFTPSSVVQVAKRASHLGDVCPYSADVNNRRRHRAASVSCREDDEPRRFSLRQPGTPHDGCAHRFDVGQDSGDGRRRTRRSRSRSPSTSRPSKRANRRHSALKSPSIDASPPPTERREVPEHIKWLHDRWSKYDQPGFFSKSIALKPADLNQKLHYTDGLKNGLEDYKKLQDNKNKPEATFSKKINERNKSRSIKNQPENDNRPGLWNRKILDQKSDYLKWRYGGLSRDELPHLMNFKEFLLSLSEDIGHSEQEQIKAVNLYTEYKLNFKRRAFKEFFDQHKDEEWFLQKYHPAHKVRYEAKRSEVVRKRLDVFMFLLIGGWIEAHAEYTDSRKIRKLLDAACVLLQGGKEQDILLLSDFDYVLEEKREQSYDVICEEQEKKNENSNCPEYSKKDSQAMYGNYCDVDAFLENSRIEEEEKKKSATELEIAQHAKDYTRYVKAHTQFCEASCSEPLALPPHVSSTGTETKYVGEGVFVERPRLMLDDRKQLSETSLHRCFAVCFRDLSPKITRHQLEAMCSDSHGGFLRLFLSEPDPDRGYCRQAIASFQHDANAMKICWNLRARKLDDGQLLNVIEHRDFSKRIDLIDGLASDKSIVLRDIQLCKSLIGFLDQRHMLWAPQGNNPTAPKINPLLVNLDECLTYHLRLLIESGQVKELADIDVTALEEGSNNLENVKLVDRDENLIKILDRLILYLRIVHSIDYYGCKFCENEDDEPRRIGMMHLRGPCYKQATPKQLAQHIQAFEQNLQRLLPNENRLADEHVELLGKKEFDQESQDFVTNNILSVQDGLSKCCACYKRFTSLEFAKDHFKQKHVDRLEQHKLDVVAFNNYLYDPNRLCHVHFLS